MVNLTQNSPWTAAGAPPAWPPSSKMLAKWKADAVQKRSRASRVLKRRQGVFVLHRWKKQRPSLKGWMRNDYKELIWNQSSPRFIYCFRNPSTSMMNHFQSSADPLEGNSTSCSCSVCPEVVHSSPTCSVHNSVDFPEPRVCQAGWALAGASSASSLLRCTHITNFQKQAERLGGATQPHGKAPESWLFGERPWIFCGWSVHLREAISLKGSLAKNISEKHHTWKPLNKNSYFIF